MGAEERGNVEGGSYVLGILTGKLEAAIGEIKGVTSRFDQEIKGVSARFELDLGRTKTELQKQIDSHQAEDDRRFEVLTTSLNKITNWRYLIMGGMLLAAFVGNLVAPIILGR